MSPSRLAGPLGAAVLTLAMACLSGCSDDADRGVAVVADDVTRSTVIVDDTAAAGDGRTTEPTGEPEADGSAGTGDTTASTGTAPGGASADGDPPGDVFDGYVDEGAELTVVGVTHDDVLNVRSGPGTDFGVVDELDPIGETVEATGRARLLSRSIWYEIDTGPAVGWVNAGYLAYPGAVDDVTAEVIDSIGSRPGPLGLEELGRLVAEDRASVEPASRISLAVASGSGDPGEVTFDVLGFGDDALSGLRLRVSADGEGDDWTLSAVEQTALCGRGVDAEGRCL